MKSALTVFLQPIIYRFIYLYLIFFFLKCEGNRQEGQGSPNRGNGLQVSDIFFKISSLSSRRKQTLHGNVFLELLMKLCICFGICLSSKWLHLKLTFFLFSNFGLIIAQQTSIHVNCFMMHLLPSYLKNAYCGRGAW